MKVLQICNKIPYPPEDGGSVAMLNISRSLALAGHEVHIVAMNTSKHHAEISDIPVHLSSLIKFRYVAVDTSIYPVRLIINLLLKKQPYNAERFDKTRFRDALSQVLQERVFDVVQLEGLYLRPYMSLIRRLHKGLVVYRAHNIEHAIWEGMASRPGNFLKKLYLHNLAQRIRQYESGFINQYDLLVPISDEDKDTLNVLGNTKPACVIPVGMMPENFRQTQLEKPPTSLFFIGALDWMPNQEALNWFIDEVWINLNQKYPLLSFHVAGRNAPQWIVRKCADTNISYHGQVSDSQAFMDAYDIMVVPLFTGSGIRVKIIEGMARSRIVITTPIGAQGLQITDSVHLILVQSPNEYHQAIEGLINNIDYCRVLQKNAFSFAHEKYSNAIIIKSLIDFYMENLAC